MSRRGVVLFLALGLVWGIPYAFIKIAVAELTPEMLVLARTGLAALLLLPLAFWRGEVLPVLRRWKPLALYTVVEIVVPWYFINSAEQRLPSSVVGLLIATVPIVGVGIAFLFGRSARLSRTNWAGLLLGLAGVGALVGFDIAGSDLIGVLELTVVVLGYALGPAILARTMSDLPGLGVVALSLAGAAVAYVPIVTATGGFPTVWPSTEVVVAVVVLAVLCSAVAFLLMFALVAQIGPVRMTAVTYLNPAVAVVAGVLLLDERITSWTLVGFAGVLAGSYLVNRRAELPLLPEDAGLSTAAIAQDRTDPTQDGTPQDTASGRAG